MGSVLPSGLSPCAVASFCHSVEQTSPCWSQAGPAPCPINTHKSFTCCTHQRHLFLISIEICHQSELPILSLKEFQLTFASAKNVINFLNTAVDLLLRWRGATRDSLLPLLCIMECIIASVFTRLSKRETE